MTSAHSLWLQFVLGIWVMLSPWLLGFSSIPVLMWGNLLAGLALVLVNMWAIFGEPRAGRE